MHLSSCVFSNHRKRVCNPDFKPIPQYMWGIISSVKYILEVELRCEYGFGVSAYTFVILFKCYKINVINMNALVWKDILFYNGVLVYQLEYIWVYFGSVRVDSSSCQQRPIDIVFQEIGIWSCNRWLIIPHNVMKRNPVSTGLRLHKNDMGRFTVHPFHFLGGTLWRCIHRNVLVIVCPVLVGVVSFNYIVPFGDIEIHWGRVLFHPNYVTCPLE